MDCKLQRTWTGEYFLCIPHAYSVEDQGALNHEALKVCYLDPGVRTFQTIYDASNNCAYQVAPGDVSRVVRLCIGLDKLNSKRDKALNAKKRYQYKLVMDRDINGAKNIFLKNYEALGFDLTLGHTPCDLATGRCTETEMSLLNF